MDDTKARLALVALGSPQRASHQARHHSGAPLSRLPLSMFRKYPAGSGGAQPPARQLCGGTGPGGSRAKLRLPGTQAHRPFGCRVSAQAGSPQAAGTHRIQRAGEWVRDEFERGDVYRDNSLIAPSIPCRVIENMRSAKIWRIICVEWV